MSVDRLCKTGLFTKLPIENLELKPEIMLFRSVLDRALLDTFHPNKKYRHLANKWLDKDDEDFIECCLMAELDPKLVYDLFFEIRKVLKGKNAKFKHFNRSK